MSRASMLAGGISLGGASAGTANPGWSIADGVCLVVDSLSTTSRTTPTITTPPMRRTLRNPGTATASQRTTAAKIIPSSFTANSLLDADRAVYMHGLWLALIDCPDTWATPRDCSLLHVVVSITRDRIES